MLRSSIGACLLVVSAACNGGTGPAEPGASPLAWQNPGSGRDDPGPGRDDPGTGRDNPGSGRDNPPTGGTSPGVASGSGSCPPCSGAYACTVEGLGSSENAAPLPSGACEFTSEVDGAVAVPTVLLCDGTVTTSGEEVGTWLSDGQGGFLVFLPYEGGVLEVDCSPG